MRGVPLALPSRKTHHAAPSKTGRSRHGMEKWKTGFPLSHTVPLCFLRPIRPERRAGGRDPVKKENLSGLDMREPPLAAGRIEAGPTAGGASGGSEGLSTVQRAERRKDSGMLSTTFKTKRPITAVLPSSDEVSGATERV